MSLKLIALASLAEYTLLKPLLLPRASDSTDFIGFGLCMVVLAYFTQIYLQDMTPPQMRECMKAGGVGGTLGLAWLLFWVGREHSQIHHLLVANLGILGPMLGSAWKQRKEAKKLGRRGGGQGGKLPSGGGSGGGPRTAKDMDRVTWMKPGQGGCCGLSNGMPVD